MNDDNYSSYPGANSSESVRQAIRYGLAVGAVLLGLLITPATRCAIFSIAAR